MVNLRLAESDADVEKYRMVLGEVEPGQRVPTVAEMRARERPGRALILAEVDGEPVGSGFVDRSDQAGRSFMIARVRPAFRRRGYGTTILQMCATLAESLGFPTVGTSADDPGSAVFAQRFGFVEVDRQVEQLRAIADEPYPLPPEGVRFVSVAERPELWREAYFQVALEAFEDFAIARQVQISLEHWENAEINEPAATFLALHGDDIIGVGSLMTDEDDPRRAEHGLTAVRRAWRGRGVASALKRQTLAWAAENGLTEVYTWTQKNNADMRRLNEHLGYRYGLVSISLEAPLPLPAAPAPA